MKTALSRSVTVTISVLFLALSACSKEPDNAAAAKPPAATVDDIPTAASPLAIAAISGDLAKIRSLLEAGAEIEATDALGRTPLHMAAFYGRTRATELLLASGATIEVRDRIGMTPLHAAVLAGGRHVVELLLDRKADPNARTDTGQTPLHLAAATGQPRVARLLIERGCRPEEQGQARQDPDLLRLAQQASDHDRSTAALCREGRLTAPRHNRWHLPADRLAVRLTRSTAREVWRIRPS
jgi:hypothetical protein